MARRMIRRLRPMPIDSKIRWLGADTVKEAAAGLALRARSSAEAGNGTILVVGKQGGLLKALTARLRNTRVTFKIAHPDDLAAFDEKESATFSLILCASTSAREQTQIALSLARHPVLAEKPFEHVAGLDSSRKDFRRFDEYSRTDFVSPVLLDDPTPYDIYRQSLQHFQQKCGFRDYLDLYQLLKNVVDNDVPGSIAEFGSFRGHSGWLIAKTLEAIGSSKQLYMFDTFESFPVESYGVDHFWSASHHVDFEEVREKFAEMPRVTLVKGDFTETLVDSGIDKLALAYIDCDSYRATRYLLQTLRKSFTVPRGIMVCEDYGHPALLGNRVAVHEVCDDLSGWFRYFSQFSGLYVMVNMEL